MKVKISQPLWQHPTRVMMIDDERSVLEGATDQLDPKFPFAAFTSPKKALEYLKQNVLPLEFLSHEIIRDVGPANAEQLSSENVSINFSPLRSNLDNADRFNYFSVLVIDKAMDEMDGLDFCRTVRKLGLPVKIILLTGIAGEKEAITAFNDRIIDAFIKKSTPHVMEQVNNHIKQLAFQEFCDSSAVLLGALFNRFPLLSQEAFSKFINKTCENENADECYILDSSCSYLLIKPTGSAKSIWIKFPQDFKIAYELASDNKIDDTVLKHLNDRTAFPFTGINQSYYFSDHSQWKDKMVPMQYHEELDFHYAIVDVPDETIFSFNRYVKEVWEPKIK